MMILRLLCLFLVANCIFCEDRCSLLCASGVCCQGSNGNFLCCPSPNGVCCESGDFCCPQGTICGPDNSCTKIQSGFFGLINHFTSSPPQLPIPTLPPNKTPTVKVNSTLSSCPSICGDRCCPHINGVCCGDGDHCCPPGYQCDLFTESCRLSSQQIIADAPINDRTCPLDDSGCSSSETCCIMFDGSKGCCPHDHADCCADGFHCCPRGSRCRSDSQGCVPYWGAWVNPFEPSNRLTNRRSTIACPNGKSGCFKGSTCCKTSESNGESYACCPMENAVCCDDGEHCCPQGHFCDPNNGGTCVRQSPESATSPSRKILPSPSNEVKMCDNKTYCEGPNVTCCKLAGGSWGCCPFSEAVCCDDFEHCCPSGYTCNPRGICLSSDLNDKSSLPWSAKMPAKDAVGRRCSDGKSSCPDSMTCCPVDNNISSCCPMPNAVCCEDHEHCCPHGSRCDVVHRQCIRDEDDSLNVPLTKKVTPDQLKITTQSVCNGGATACSTGGVTGCCPLKNAVCCSDGLHCCEEGYACAPNGQCLKKGQGDLLVRAPRLLPSN